MPARALAWPIAWEGGRGLGTGAPACDAGALLVQGSRRVIWGLEMARAGASEAGAGGRGVRECGGRGGVRIHRRRCEPRERPGLGPLGDRL